ncbi:hypothetical protein CEE34_02330 [Candidatus Aerophobetes bacterium Ae_b3a]|nr:carbohydrate ABC transporter permease [Candidatus Aerophobetes bacterium]TKJ47686.1 MAG: hypothetical protein CEE34_02330 [Candidatus Aerophobetes bacterium Ae_b3a]
MRSKRKSQIIRAGVVYIFLAVGAVTFLIPLAWMFVTSLKIPTQIFTFPPIWIPNPVRWENYPEALMFIPFAKYLFNTLYLCIMNVVGTILSCSLVAYGLSRIRWPGRNIVFIAIISIIILPYQVIMIPLYIIYQHVGWLGTYKPLWVPAFLAARAFYIFLLHQFFMNIPHSISDAAKIDGCSEFSIYWRIVFPLSKAALFTVGLLQFLEIWNDFLRPLIYISEDSMFTLSLGLSGFQGAHHTAVNLLMAVSSMMTIPIIVIFFFTQRTFVEGITLTGLKG